MRSIPTHALHDYDAWRARARALLIEGIPPDKIVWAAGAPQEELFGNDEDIPLPAQSRRIFIPRAFARLAESVLMHRDPSKFALLYGILWRLHVGHLHVSDAADMAVRRANVMAKAVGRDMHKMRAFVRFREAVHQDGSCFVAWFEPDHLIMRANAAFFVRRFTNMEWAILTPDLCLHWDRITLRESPGLEAQPEQADDPIEALWTRYYAATFNPARVKIGAMLKEMPRRYWKNMPETSLIANLLAKASAREADMFSFSAKNGQP